MKSAAEEDGEKWNREWEAVRRRRGGLRGLSVRDSSDKSMTARVEGRQVLLLLTRCFFFGALTAAPASSAVDIERERENGLAIVVRTKSIIREELRNENIDAGGPWPFILVRRAQG